MVRAIPSAISLFPLSVDFRLPASYTFTGSKLRTCESSIAKSGIVHIIHIIHIVFDAIIFRSSHRTRAVLRFSCIYSYRNIAQDHIAHLYRIRFGLNVCFSVLCHILFILSFVYLRLAKHIVTFILLRLFVHF